MTASESYDCIVMGGGPAGATVSTLLADAGHHTLVLERGRFPRHHIGESLMPQTYWVLERLGVLDQLKRSDCPVKQSVQFVSASGKVSQPFYFTDYDPHESSKTWQVRRGEFDRMMLDNAKAHGVEVIEGAAVREVLFDGTRAVGVRVSVDDRQVELKAKVVVDATGQTTLLARQLNLRQSDTALNHGCIYAYYQGAARGAGRDAGATVIVHTTDRDGWFWFIPLQDDVVSIGLVAPPAYLFTGRGDEPLKTLQEELANCPWMVERLANAQLSSQVYVTSDFSYRARQVAGDGWVLIGDAFGFLDPVYSAGVMLALKSGEMAADAIHDALEAHDLSGERLGVFGPKLVGGMQFLRQLIYAFYDPKFSIGEFTRANPACRDRLVRMLIGDVFNDEVGTLFEVMRDWVDLPEAIPLQRS